MIYNEREMRLLRIGIFYDGNYFYHVSNYYCYGHPRKSRLSIPGIHDFIKKYIALQENINPKFCQIVDCHYFRGRLPAMEANERQILLNERVFDDILMREGIVTHYLPMSRGGEKGVDVSLALEVLELTIFKKFNVVVLIASDGDYVPLVRKLNSLGTRVMVLGWDFEYTDDNGNQRYTSTSSKLMNDATYPIRMHDVINGTKKIPEVCPDMLFVNQQSPDNQYVPAPGENLYFAEESSGEPAQPPRLRGKIVQLRGGYGFISTDIPSKNLFFFIEELRNCDFNELQIGDLMEYEPGMNDRGECCKNITLISHAAPR